MLLFLLFAAIIVHGQQKNEQHLSVSTSVKFSQPCLLIFAKNLKVFISLKLFSKLCSFHKEQRILFTYFREEFAGVRNVKFFSTHAFHEEVEGN